MNTKESTRKATIRCVAKAFLRGLACPLDFSDPPADSRKPFVPVRPLPAREAFARSLERTCDAFSKGLRSREADELFQRYNVQR